MKLDSRNTAFILIGLGIILRLILPLILDNDPFKGDGEAYLRYGMNLLNAHTFSGGFAEHVEADIQRMPGVPFLIYLGLHLGTPDSYWVLLPNLVLDIGILITIYFFIQKLELKFANLWLGIFCFVPVMDFYASQYYPLIPAAFFTLLSFHFLLLYSKTNRQDILIFSVSMLAISLYFRPEIILLVPVFFMAIWQSNPIIKHRFIHGVTVVLTLLVLLLPWTIRNYIVSDKFAPFGNNFLLENTNETSLQDTLCAKGLYAWMNTWHFKESHIKNVAWDFIQADFEPISTVAFENETEKQLVLQLQEKANYTCESDGILFNLAVQKRAGSPLQNYLWLPLKRIFFLLFRIERSDNYRNENISIIFIIGGFGMISLIGNIFNLLGIIGSWFRKNRPGIISWIMIACTIRLIFFAFFYHVELRYMLAFYPLLFICGAWFLQSFLNFNSSENDN